MAIHAQDPEDPQYYAKSRAALRDLYGSRKIIAKTHYSDADSTPSAKLSRATGIVDTTPSGRDREMRGKGIGEDRLAPRTQSYWDRLFQPNPDDRAAVQALDNWGSARPKTPPSVGSGMFDALKGLPHFVPAPTPPWPRPMHAGAQRPQSSSGGR